MNDFPEVSANLVRLEPDGMISHINEPVPFEDWLEFGNKLWTVHNAIQWAIGDWVEYGKTHYGEKYSQALDITRYTEGTLYNFGYVARNIETSRRRENLSWTHHAAVASLEPDAQDTLLDIAESQQMGRDELRDEVKRYKSPDGLLVVGSTYRVIEGSIGQGNKFNADTGEMLPVGKAILHLYEDGE